MLAPFVIAVPLVISLIIIEGGEDLIMWIMRKRRSRRYRNNVKTYHREYR